MYILTNTASVKEQVINLRDDLDKPIPDNDDSIENDQIHDILRAMPSDVRDILSSMPPLPNINLFLNSNTIPIKQQFAAINGMGYFEVSFLEHGICIKYFTINLVSKVSHYLETNTDCSGLGSESPIRHCQTPRDPPQEIALRPISWRNTWIIIVIYLQNVFRNDSAMH